MNGELHILMLEDNPIDTELNVRELRKDGFTFTWKQVETREEFIAALDDFKPDIILSDYQLPSFDGIEALAIRNEKMPDTPFLFVTGKMGEDFAIETFHLGADDYVLKSMLHKLVPAVNRAISLRDERKKRLEAEKSLKEANKNLEKTLAEVRLFQTCFIEGNDAKVILDADRRIAFSNTAFWELTGYTEEEARGKTLSIIKSDFFEPGFHKAIWEYLLTQGPWVGDMINKRKDGTIFQCRFSLCAICNDKGEADHFLGTFMNLSTTPLQ